MLTTSKGKGPGNRPTPDPDAPIPFVVTDRAHRYLARRQARRGGTGTPPDGDLSVRRPVKGCVTIQTDKPKAAQPNIPSPRPPERSPGAVQSGPSQTSLQR